MKKTYLIALAMVTVIVLWMASGLLRTTEDKISSVSSIQNEQSMLVQTAIQVAEPVQLTLTVQGHVEPNRSVQIRSDIAGRIADILVDKGEWVTSDTVLVRLEVEDRLIKLNREKALLQSRLKAYARAKSLTKGNYQSKSVLEEAYAALKDAEASVAQIELEIKKLDISAPFAGVLEMRMVEQGGYVAANDDIARFVDNSPLVVVVPVAQQNIQQLTLGTQAQVRFATGEDRKGKIRYISPLATESTRTFRVEITVENPDRVIPAGISAEVKIPTQELKGHFVSPAILGLDANGQIGVKTVDDNDTVVFHSVSIIQAAAEGIWVKGLPQTARIITVGQGFVEAGVKVEIQEDAVKTLPSLKSDVGIKSNIAQKVSP